MQLMRGKRAVLPSVTYSGRLLHAMEPARIGILKRFISSMRENEGGVPILSANKYLAKQLARIFLSQ